MRMRFLVGWLLCLVLALGCSAERGVELDGRAFLYSSGQGFTPVAGSTVFLSFSDGQVSISADCNGIGGAYRLRSGRLVATELGQTEKGCEPQLLAQDEVLVKFITSRPRLTLEGDTLTLAGDDGVTMVFLDREVADPDRPLTGTRWGVDSFIQGDGVSNVPLSADPTLLFRTDGVVEVNTLCNRGTGNYTVSGDRITLTGITFTERPCAGGPAAADTQLKAVFKDGTVTFVIEARSLTIERGNVGIGAVARSH